MNPLPVIDEDRKIVPFQPWHMLALDMRDIDRKALGPFRVIEMAPVFAASGYSFTGLWRGRPACCFGTVMCWAGRAQLWMATSAIIDANKIAFHRVAKAHIDGLFPALGLRRLEALCLPEHTRSRRWLEALGFALETPGVMRAYGPGGEDMLLYARVDGGEHGN